MTLAIFYFIFITVAKDKFFSLARFTSCHYEGLTFSDPIHNKSARNLNLYNFCHSPKKLAAVSPFSLCVINYHLAKYVLTL
jgi:hypothetical protein